jgi:hypothetical protein
LQILWPGRRRRCRMPLSETVRRAKSRTIPPSPQVRLPT